MAPSTPKGRIRHPPVSSPIATDVALAAFVLVAVGAAITADLEPDAQTPNALAYVFAIGLAAPMLVRRRWPVGALLATVVTLLAYYALGYPGIGLAVPVAAALYSAAEIGRLRPAIAIAVGLLVLTTGYRLAAGQRPAYLLVYDLPLSATLMAAVIALGDAVRSRRELHAEAQRRAERAAAERDQEAARRVEQERLRIARDLHDVLGHTVSVVSLQAGVAAEALPGDPEAALAALGVVRSATRNAMRDLRSTLAVLRDPAAAEPLDPAVGLERLDTVLRSARESGLDVTCRITGTPTPVPAVVDIAAYRIVQEAMTNVLRHARASHATVHLHYQPSALAVGIRDDGRGSVERTSDAPGPSTPGHGLAGMAERVAVLGGTLHAGNSPERGFFVEALLPLRGQP